MSEETTFKRAEWLKMQQRQKSILEEEVLRLVESFEKAHGLRVTELQVVRTFSGAAAILAEVQL